MEFGWIFEEMVDRLGMRRSEKYLVKILGHHREAIFGGGQTMVHGGMKAEGGQRATKAIFGRPREMREDGD